MTADQPLKILVVDDSSGFRKILTDILSELPGIEIVGSANTGKSALARVTLFKPDLLTLDVEMPEMDGLEVLANLKEYFPEISAVVLTSLSERERDMAMKALNLGAFDVVPKPQCGSLLDNRKALRDAFIPVLKAFRQHREIKTILNSRPAARTQPAPPKVAPADSASVINRMRSIAGQRIKPEIVGIAVSTGGPKALDTLMKDLPPNLGVPVLIVQHMPPQFTLSLAQSLNSKCPMEIKEADDGDLLRPNVAYIAPGGRQMKLALAPDGKGKIIRITDDPPENSCRPSADYTFRSIADLYMDKAAGVIMTGMGCDGVAGLKLLKRHGCTVIAQDQATCVVFGMPKEAIDAGVVDIVAPLDRLAAEIRRVVSG
ncbi:MAG: chemotaxis response regulator protein-glutamate methylesterase [Pseudomonadota bacterium]